MGASVWPVLDNHAAVEVEASGLEVLMADSDPVAASPLFWASYAAIGFRTA